MKPRQPIRLDICVVGSQCVHERSCCLSHEDLTVCRDTPNSAPSRLATADVTYPGILPLPWRSQQMVRGWGRRWKYLPELCRKWVEVPSTTVWCLSSFRSQTSSPPRTNPWNRIAALSMIFFIPIISATLEYVVAINGSVCFHRRGKSKDFPSVVEFP